MTPIVIGDQGFIKTEKGWVDAKSKKPAPEMLIKALDMAYAQMTPDELLTAPSKPLPKPKAAAASSSAPKQERNQQEVLKKVAALTKAIEKLTKIFEDKAKKKDAPADPVAKEQGAADLMPAEDRKIPEPLSFKDSLKAKLKDSVRGERDRYGNVTKPGLLRNLGMAISPTIGGMIFGARDRRRESIAEGLKAHEYNLNKNSPSMDRLDVDQALKEKRRELKGMAPAAVAETKSAVESLPGQRERLARSRDVGDEEQNESVEPKANKFAAAKADANTPMRVEIVDIGDNVISKLKEAFSGAKGDNDSTAEPEQKEDTRAGGGFNPLSLLGGGLGKIGKVFGSGAKLAGRGIKGAARLAGRGARALGSGIKSVGGAAGRMFGPRTKLNSAGQLINSKTGRYAAAKGGGILGRLGGRAAGGLAAKAIGKSVLKKIPVVGALAGLGFAGARALKGDWSGAGMEAASGLAGTIPGIGTAASLGIDAALMARDMGQDDPGAPAAPVISQPPATMVSPPITPRTSNLIQANRTNTTAKINAAKPSSPQISNVNAPQTIVNNSSSVMGGQTTAPRGSLDLSNFT